MTARKPEELTEQETVDYDLIRVAVDELARKGLIVDSGRRRWCNRTGRYEIVWVLAKDTAKRH